MKKLFFASLMVLVAALGFLGGTVWQFTQNYSENKEIKTSIQLSEAEYQSLELAKEQLIVEKGQVSEIPDWKLSSYKEWSEWKTVLENLELQ